MTNRVDAAPAVIGVPGVLVPASPQMPSPSSVISNSVVRALVYLPDPVSGFYRSTRFEWSGMVAALDVGGHRFYDPWFTRSEPGVRDFVYRGDQIVAGPESSAVGLAEEFSQPLGFDAAAGDGSFVKIGVGVLRRATGAPYSPFNPYAVVDAGTWTSDAEATAVTSTHTVDAPTLGYAYRYRKTVRLIDARPELLIEHELVNTGRLPIETTQYNHNFLRIDGTATGTLWRIVVPFDIRTVQPPDKVLAAIRGGEIAYVRALMGEERVAFPVEGFSDRASDFDVRIENRDAGVRITSDRPMTRAYFWSIRSVVSFEPFVDVRTAPGASTTWCYRYRYTVGPANEA